MIILASASPRRRQLLKKIVKKFRVVISQVEESSIKAATPARLAEKLALAKALDVAASHPQATIIGADTIVVLGNKILGKPRHKKEAAAMLRSLSNKTHKVITGLAIVIGKKRLVFPETTYVSMKALSQADIQFYVDSGKPLDKAGAYGIQEIEALFVDKIKGDYDNVVGLPTLKLKKRLNSVGPL